MPSHDELLHSLPIPEALPDRTYVEPVPDVDPKVAEAIERLRSKLADQYRRVPPPEQEERP